METRQDYPNLLTSLQPAQAVHVLNDRVKLINKINSDIADWLAERRKIEEAYAHGLRKLARRPQQDGAAALGVFQIPWQRIVASAEEIALSHETFASKIDADVESPLRQYASKNRELQSMATIQGNLASIARDIESAQKKAEKKRGLANGSVDDAISQWESQAPYVFEQLQSVDESRVNHLRDVLTQYQTHEADQVERSRATTESCLNALLTIETADEIKTFAARTIAERPNIPTRQSSNSISVVHPLPPPPRLTEDRHLPRPGSSRQEKPQPEPTKHSGLSLKRLGTVMGRRKSTLPPVNPSPDKSKKSRGFGSFRREDSSRSFQQVDSPPQTARGLTPVTSQDEGLTPQSSVPQTLQEPMRPATAQTVQQADDVDQITPIPAPFTNGTTHHEPSPLPEVPPTTTPVTNTEPFPPVGPLTPISEQPSRLDAISLAEQEAAAANESEDALRSLRIRDQPIQEDEGEAKEAFDTMASQLRLQAKNSGLRPQGSMRGRRDVRNTIFIPNPETLDIPNGVSPNLSPSSHLTPVAASLSAASITASPIVKPRAAPGSILEDRASDANSIHSSHTLSSTTGGHVHPDLHEPGLNASIVETISSWFANGTVSKAFAIGEVALAYNPTADGISATEETIRLENFQYLEKVAANPAFVTATASEKGKEKEDTAGEYILNLTPISKPTPTVAFKYQLHLDPEAPSTYTPFIVTPAWQVQDTQVSVIIQYSLNPSFTLPNGETSVTLKNVILTVSLDTAPDSGKAINAMMAPQTGAVFKKRQSAVVWKLPELVVNVESQRLLARFFTTGAPPKAGHVEAKWELPGLTASSLGVSSISGASADIDPFADETAAPPKTWSSVPVTSKLVSGRYTA